LNRQKQEEDSKVKKQPQVTPHQETHLQVMPELMQEVMLPQSNQKLLLKKFQGDLLDNKVFQEENMQLQTVIIGIKPIL